MPSTNHFKFGASGISSATRGGFKVGVVGGADYGPTSTTGFWNGVTPPVGGYTIYVDKASQGPSIHVANNDSQCIFKLKAMGATGSTISDVLAWVAGQANMVVLSAELTIGDLPGEGGSSIVTNGLILNLDASNASSYPGTGTTWTDLSGNGNNATLVNSPTYSSNLGGSITLNGSNQYIALPTSNVLNSNADFTCDIAFNMIGVGGSRTVMAAIAIGALQMRADSQPSYISLVRSDQAELGGFGASSSITINTPVVVSLVLNKSTNTFSLYKNGIFISTLNPGNQSFNTASPILGAHLGQYEFTNESFFTFKWYNRQLSSGEVLQNFNSVKTRLGL